MLKKSICAAVIGTATALSAAQAQSTGLSFGVSGGTDGVGPDVFYKLGPLVQARGGFRYMEFGLTRDFDDVEYDYDMNFTSGVAALDLHPLRNGLRVSAGAYFGNRTVDLVATPTQNVTVGPDIYTPAELGSLVGEAEWNGTAPFVGVGFNNGAYALKRFGFQALLGLAYIGEPEVTLTAVGGTQVGSTDLLLDLEDEADDIQEDLDDFPFYPVASLGFTVRF